MSQMSIVKIKEQALAFSWTTGLVKVNHTWKIRNDSDALAYALYLSNRGLTDEAECFLDTYCS